VPGTTTSEFKLTAAGIISAAALLVVGKLTADVMLVQEGVTLLKWVIGGYALSRGLAKGKARS
jgi:hypothetical protein